MKTSLRLVISMGCLLASFSLLSSVSTLAQAHGYEVGELKIDHPYIRATPPGAQVAGGFMTIHNAGHEDDRLIGGSVDFADAVEVHEMAMQGDIMLMQQVAGGLVIPAGADVVLKPGSYHVMFINLHRALKVGEKVSGVLQFAKAGPVEVVFSVEVVTPMMKHQGNPQPQTDGHAHGASGHMSH